MKEWPLFSRRRRDQSLDEEIEAHLAMATRDRIERGEDAHAAEAATHREFGNRTLIQETTREMWGWGSLEAFVKDTRHALRQLRKAPGFTLTAVLVLALGVGANTAVFSIIDAVLLRSLPYTDSDRLLWIGEVIKGNTVDEVTLTPDFLNWREQNHAFTAIGAFNVLTRTLTGVAEPVQIRTVKASSALLPLLKVQPLLGRNFSQNEDQKGHDQVAILSYSLWQQSFGGSNTAIGRDIRLDDQVFVVIGVMPREFHFPVPEAIELLTPLGKNEAAELKRSDGMTIVHDVIARLKPGVTMEQARAEMEVIQSHTAPPSFLSHAQITVRVLPLRDRLVGDVRTTLFVLLGAVGFLLVLACANVANLLLGRAVSRQREMAIRSALGASRARLVKQILVESLVLAGIGCAGGLALAFWTRSVLLSFVPKGIPGLEALPLDLRVLGFAAMSACASALIFGLGPALTAAGAPIAHSLSSSGRSLIGGTRRQLWLNLLASTQLAIAIVLLTGGGLMLQSFWNLRYRNLGFRPERLLAMRLQPSRARYPHGAKQTAFLDELLESLGNLPGVDGAAAGDLPPGDGHATNNFVIEGRPEPPAGRGMIAGQFAVSASYFRLLDIPLLKGRTLMESDTVATNPVVLINDALARRYFRGENPIGQSLRTMPADPWRTIAGVVQDVKNAGLAASPEPTIYFPYRQTGGLGDSEWIVIRTPLNPIGLESELRKRVTQLDPQQPVGQMQTLDQRLNESASRPRLATILLGCFAALGLVLATVGLYGVMSFLVRWRFSEIGIRLAIGAQPRDVMGMILIQGFKVIFAGIAVGICGALVSNRLIQSLLYGVSAVDPLTFSLTVGFLAFVALMACYIPARQASKIDPMTTLQSE
jgi:putative ABC transport system permease protein